MTTQKIGLHYNENNKNLKIKIKIISQLCTSYPGFRSVFRKGTNISGVLMDFGNHLALLSIFLAK